MDTIVSLDSPNMNEINKIELGCLDFHSGKIIVSSHILFDFHVLLFDLVFISSDGERGAGGYHLAMDDKR